jgi:predicted dehydrogenase
MPSATDGYFNEIDYFLGCIEKNQKPKISTPAESRLAVAIALAEVKSAQTGKSVVIK